jgi:hypothetical protein
VQHQACHIIGSCCGQQLSCIFQQEQKLLIAGWARLKAESQIEARSFFVNRVIQYSSNPYLICDNQRALNSVHEKTDTNTSCLIPWANKNAIN